MCWSLSLDKSWLSLFTEQCIVQSAEQVYILDPSHNFGRASRGKERSRVIGLRAAARVRPKGLPAAARPCPVVQRLPIAAAASVDVPAVDPHIALQEYVLNQGGVMMPRPVLTWTTHKACQCDCVLPAAGHTWAPVYGNIVTVGPPSRHPHLHSGKAPDYIAGVRPGCCLISSPMQERSGAGGSSWTLTAHGGSKDDQGQGIPSL